MAHSLLTDLEKILPLKDNLPTDDNTGRIGNKAHNRKSTHTLATGTLADETNAFSLLNVVRQAVDRSKLTILHVEIGLKVFYLQYFLCDVYSPPLLHFTGRDIITTIFDDN